MNPGPEFGWSADATPEPSPAAAADASPLLDIARPYDVYRFPPGVHPLEFYRRVMRSMKTEVRYA